MVVWCAWPVKLPWAKVTLLCRSAPSRVYYGDDGMEFLACMHKLRRGVRHQA